MKTDNLTYSFLALRDKLHRSALGFLKNDEDAKDALQDTFFNLYKNGGIQTESEARNKLFTVLRNVCIDKLRKTRTIPLTGNDWKLIHIRLKIFRNTNHCLPQD